MKKIYIILIIVCLSVSCSYNHIYESIIKKDNKFFYHSMRMAKAMNKFAEKYANEEGMGFMIFAQLKKDNTSGCELLFSSYKKLMLDEGLLFIKEFAFNAWAALKRSKAFKEYAKIVKQKSKEMHSTQNSLGLIHVQDCIELTINFINKQRSYEPPYIAKITVTGSIARFYTHREDNKDYLLIREVNLLHDKPNSSINKFVARL